MFSILISIGSFVLTAKFIVGLVVGAFVPGLKLYLIKAAQAAEKKV